MGVILLVANVRKGEFVFEYKISPLINFFSLAGQLVSKGWLV